MSKLRVDEIGNTGAKLALGGNTTLDLTAASTSGNGIVVPKASGSYTNQVGGSPLLKTSDMSFGISDGLSKINSVKVYQTPTYANGLVEEGLVAYYDAARSFDYSTGTPRALDLSGNNHHQYFFGTARFGRQQAELGGGYNGGDYVGDSFIFDGAQGTYMENTDNFDYNPMSFGCVFYNYSTIIRENSIGGSSGNYQGLVGFVDPNGANGYGVTLGGWTGSVTNESVEIWSFSPSGMTYLATEIPIGYNYFCYNWNVHEERYDLWVNGWKMPVFPGTSGHAKGYFRESARIRLGGTNYPAGNPNYVFYGEIFNYFQYGRPLTDIEVIRNNNVAKEFIMRRRENRGYYNTFPQGGVENRRG